MALDLQQFAYSFSHAAVTVGGRQFTDISAVAISQDLKESAVYGTDVRPLKRSVGQLDLGKGQLTFSDLGEARDFYKSLGDQPFLALWELSYALSHPDGQGVLSVDCKACRLTSFGIQHSAQSEALGMTFPFSFLQVKIDGVDAALSPKAIIQAGLSIAQGFSNLL